MNLLKNVFFALLAISLLSTTVAFYTIFHHAISQEYALSGVSSVVGNQSASLYLLENSETTPQKLQDPPPVIKGIYVTSWSATSRRYLSYLDQLFATTDINAVVIDVKDSSGILFYDTGAPMARSYKNYRTDLVDINSLVHHFHERGIYVMARLNVFNDSALAKDRPDLAILSNSKSNFFRPQVLWQDSKKTHWLDPASEEVWQYNIEIAHDLLSHGFDEINFDYIRFPSDGNIGDIVYVKKSEFVPHRVIMRNFFQKIRQSLPEATLSIDLFGQTTTVTRGDMGVGQVLENAFEYFDYIDPMIYPSHYAKGFLGYKNPAEHPYEIVKNALDTAMTRRIMYAIQNPEKKIAKLRPWIQDFDLGADYTADLVGQEIKAVNDALLENSAGFLLWNPFNRYTTEAIAK